MRLAARWPRLSLIVIDPFQELACSLTQKSEESPVGNIVHRSSVARWPRDDGVVRLDVLIRKRHGGIQ